MTVNWNYRSHTASLWASRLEKEFIESSLLFRKFAPRACKVSFIERQGRKVKRLGRKLKRAHMALVVDEWDEI